ncbi:hypothetical protein [Paraburkholderia sp.]|uniref:hypothetical protein n=1 Tax=Paraburkholderia sp. TaxID=1926495 RepID=UPI00239ABFF6|nr:hypothetical protein [Paraburkholderia sp.]MDE1182511.1 hypothetical protein [Paraburkholderia sp.]
MNDDDRAVPTASEGIEFQVQREAREVASKAVRAAGVPLGQWTRWLVIATGVWAVCELPVELWVSQTPLDAGASVIAKLVWISLVTGVMLHSRIARVAYVFLCGLSVMAVAFDLPAEYRLFRLGFYCSAVECLLKGAAFVSFVSSYMFPDDLDRGDRYSAQ